MKAKKPVSWRKMVSQRVTAVQHRAEKQLRTGWERGMEMLPPAWRKTVKRLTADVEKTRHDLNKRGEKALANFRKATDRFASRAEKRIVEVLTPVTRRLDVPTRAEVARLRKRLEHVERRMHAQGSSAAA
jgi:hypothetical protein